MLQRPKVRAVAIPVLVDDTSALWSIKHTQFLLLFVRFNGAAGHAAEAQGFQDGFYCIFRMFEIAAVKFLTRGEEQAASSKAD